MQFDNANNLDRKSEVRGIEVRGIDEAAFPLLSSPRRSRTAFNIARRLITASVAHVQATSTVSPTRQEAAVFSNRERRTACTVAVAEHRVSHLKVSRTRHR
jgi:hypothetical protein